MVCLSYEKEKCVQTKERYTPRKLAYDFFETGEKYGVISVPKDRGVKNTYSLIWTSLKRTGLPIRVVKSRNELFLIRTDMEDNNES